jgi:hypothetical protein
MSHWFIFLEIARSMRALVVHFGHDVCYRIHVLRSAGYAVRQSTTLVTLTRDLQGEQQIDAVLISENDPVIATAAAELVRRHSCVPLILFRRSEGVLDEMKFDRVYRSLVWPPFWLTEIQLSIKQCQQARKNSERLLQESVVFREKCRLERARIFEELDRNN